MTEAVKIFVVPGEGRKVPLPVPGGRSVPAAGTYVVKTLAVTRLLRTGDLVVASPPENAERVVRTTAKAKVNTAATVTSGAAEMSGVVMVVSGAPSISGATMSALHEVAGAVVSGGIISGGSAAAKGEK